MGPRMRIVILATLILTFSLLLALPVQAVTLTADEQYMLNLVNKERRANGLDALEVDTTLQFMARRYSQEMIDNNFFSHTSPVSGDLLKRVTKAGVADGWLLAGENLAGAPTVESAFSGLMNSPSHKENILEAKYTHVGIGVIDGGPYGKMFSQEFIAYPKNTYSISSDSSLDLLVYVNDNLLYSDPPAFISNGHTLVPAKQLLFELGIEATWSDNGKQIVINHSGEIILFTVDNPIVMVDGKPIALETAPVIDNNTLFIPLRFIAESLGATVNWNNNLRVISVRS